MQGWEKYSTSARAGNNPNHLLDFWHFHSETGKLDRLDSSCGRHAKMKLSISATISQIITVIHRRKVDYLTKPCFTGSGYHIQDAGWLSNCWILEKLYKHEPNCNGHVKTPKMSDTAKLVDCSLCWLLFNICRPWDKPGTNQIADKCVN